MRAEQQPSMISDRLRLFCRGAICLLLACTLPGCDSGSKIKVIPGDKTINAETHLDGIFPQVTIQAELSNGDGGVMVFNANGQETITFYYLEEQEYTLTRSYYAGDVLLGVATTTFFFSATADEVYLQLRPEEFDGNFDDDNDGWTNLAELQWASDMLDPFSSPPSHDPRFAITSGGGWSRSAQYELTDQIGKVTSSAPVHSPSNTATVNF